MEKLKGGDSNDFKIEGFGVFLRLEIIYEDYFLSFGIISLWNNFFKVF